MEFVLKHFDTPLVRFSALPDSSDPEYQVQWVNEEARQLLPQDFVPTAEGLSSWIRHRAIPKNRAFVHAFLAKCGLSINRPMGIVAVSKGLSLNDSYWVVSADFNGTFDDYNLYENRFSNVLAAVTFTGYGSSLRSSLVSSPEFTTNGMLPKCWRRIDGTIYLYKGGTSGASNEGSEPYSEFYASQVALEMGLNAIPYSLSKWKGQLCSTCELFTSKDRSYMPVGRMVTSGGMKAVHACYERLGQPFVDALNEMIVFDAIICNTDRHFGNFGFLMNSHTNEIEAPAPLFDHGNALYGAFAPLSYNGSSEELQQYVDALRPVAYDDFMEEAVAVMDDRLAAMVRKLLTFRFKKHSRYNYPDKRLKLFEQQVRKRARMLLERS